MGSIGCLCSLLVSLQGLLQLMLQLMVLRAQLVYLARRLQAAGWQLRSGGKSFVQIGKISILGKSWKQTVSSTLLPVRGARPQQVSCT